MEGGLIAVGMFARVKPGEGLNMRFLTALIFAMAFSLGIFTGFGRSMAAETQSQAPQMREFVSQEPPPVVAELLKTIQVVDALELYRYSSQGNGVVDYAIQYMFSLDEYYRWMMEGASEVPNADVVSFFAVVTAKDEQGNAKEEGRFVGIVSYRDNVSWFKDQLTKEMFGKASEAHKAK